MTVAGTLQPGVEAAAYARLEQLRWPAGVRCPGCGAASATLLAPADGLSRATRTGARTERRVWRCAGCRRQFSVLVGTVLAGTRVPISVWTATVELATVELATEGGGRLPTAEAVAERHALTRETARHIVGLLAAALGDAATGLLVGGIGGIGGIGRIGRGGRAGRGGWDADELLRRLVSLPAAEVERVRAVAGPRRRPLRQEGPTARYA